MNFVEKASEMSITEPCHLLGVPRSSYYHRPLNPVVRSDELLMQVIDRIYMEAPTFGTRRMVDALEGLGDTVGRDRVRRLMRGMGIEAIYPKPRLSVPGKGHTIDPYLLRDLSIERSNQVWCSDISYIPMGDSHVYLTAVMDWSSRYVMSWRLSNRLEAAFCVDCLEEALVQPTGGGSLRTTKDLVAGWNLVGGVRGGSLSGIEGITVIWGYSDGNLVQLTDLLAVQGVWLNASAAMNGVEWP